MPGLRVRAMFGRPCGAPFFLERVLTKVLCRLLISLTLAAAATAGTLPEGMERPMTVDDLPAGYPPKMGDISGTLGGKAMAWETFDYSIGAFDASAQARVDWETKEVSLHITGMKPGKPDEDRQRILIKADFGTALQPGPAAGVAQVLFLRGKDSDGPRLVSDRETAEVVLDSIGPQVADSYSRRMTGHVSARLCPVGWAFTKCQDVTLRFDTDVQVDGEVPINP